MMRATLVGIVAAAFVCLGPAIGAQQQSGPAIDQPRFQQVVAIELKLGHQQAWEEAQMKLRQASMKVDPSRVVLVYQGALGLPPNSYRIVLPFSEWQEREAWKGVSEMLVEAYGEQEGRQIFARMRDSYERPPVSSIWGLIEDGSANLGAAPPSNFYDVMIREVEFAGVPAHRELLAKYKAAYEAAPEKPQVARYSRLIGSGGKPMFLRLQGFNSWAEMDGHSPLDLIEAHYGREGFERLQEDLARHVISQQRHIVRFREDLSQVPPRRISRR